MGGRQEGQGEEEEEEEEEGGGGGRGRRIPNNAGTRTRWMEHGLVEEEEEEEERHDGETNGEDGYLNRISGAEWWAPRCNTT